MNDDLLVWKAWVPVWFAGRLVQPGEEFLAPLTFPQSRDAVRVGPVPAAAPPDGLTAAANAPKPKRARVSRGHAPRS